MRRILLCSADEILALGLGALSTDELELIGRVPAVSRIAPFVLELPPECRPDLILIDLAPGVTFQALSDLRRDVPETPAVLWCHEIATELAYQALGLGLRGILRKSLTPELARRCLDRVCAGELWFEKSLTDAFLTAKKITLTKREGDLVRCLAAGRKNKEIAFELGITEGTIKVYLTKLYDKCGVRDRFELALWALKNLGEGEGRLRTLVVAPPRDLAA